MKNSDFITLHCPHTPQTEGMISREMIALMKPTAYLINTARGPVVDEDALIEALRAHRIAGAALDVFASEPDINPAFAALDNVLLTPHAAATPCMHATKWPVPPADAFWTGCRTHPAEPSQPRSAGPRKSVITQLLLPRPAAGAFFVLF